jgi:hypothetical protein
LLALAAVDAMGPRAHEWARDVRARYPTADQHGLTRLAIARFTRLARATAVTAAASGPLAPVAELVGLTWTHAALVLHLAAIHDQDPTNPERAVDLLTLLRVHPDAETAREALGAATAEPANPVEAVTRLATPLAARSGAWRLRRMAGRVAPGAAGLLAGLLAVAHAEVSTERLAHGATRHFRAARQPDGATAS